MLAFPLRLMQSNAFSKSPLPSSKRIVGRSRRADGLERLITVCWRSANHQSSVERIESGKQEQRELRYPLLSSQRAIMASHTVPRLLDSAAKLFPHGSSRFTGVSLEIIVSSRVFARSLSPFPSSHLAHNDLVLQPSSRTVE